VAGLVEEGREHVDRERNVRLFQRRVDGTLLERGDHVASSTEEMPGNPYWVVGPPEEGGTRLVFVDVPEAKAVKNRVHLDLMPRDRSQEEEVARIESLGGRLIDDRRQASPGGWVVMADPEGNEFCVEGGE
jgi:hypothetical protein